MTYLRSPFFTITIEHQSGSVRRTFSSIHSGGWQIGQGVYFSLASLSEIGILLFDK